VNVKSESVSHEAYVIVLAAGRRGALIEGYRVRNLERQFEEK
jgi:hypothetical protein